MAQQPTNNAGTTAGQGQKKRDTFIALVILGFVVLGFLWGVKLGLFDFSSSSQAETRSGMYRMVDVTDNSAAGAANKVKLVQISFTEGGLNFEYPVILEDGSEVSVQVGGPTADGTGYILRHRRSDQNSMSSARWVCSFQTRAGYCQVPNLEGGTNRVEFTKL